MFYPCDLKQIDIFAEDLAFSMSNEGNKWSQFSKDEIAPIILSAIKLYFFTAHGDTLRMNSRPVPSLDELRILRKQLPIPRFIRDLAREVCRPMKMGNTIYLPDLSYEEGPNVELINIFAPIKQHIVKFSSFLNKLGYDVVEIECEAPATVPLSFYDEDLDEIWSAKELPDWRLEAFSYSRHLLYQPVGITVHNISENNAEPRKRSKVREHFSDIPFDQVYPYQTPKIGKRIGSYSGFVNTLANKRKRLGYIPVNFRFCSVEDSPHSRTPPLSRRTGRHVRDRGRFTLDERHPELHKAAQAMSRMRKKDRRDINKKTRLIGDAIYLRGHGDEPSIAGPEGPAREG